MPRKKPVHRKEEWPIEHIVDHKSDRGQTWFLIKWRSFGKKPYPLEWVRRKDVNATEIDEYLKSIKEKTGFMTFLHTHRNFEAVWLDFLRFKMRSRCMYGLKALKEAQKKWLSNVGTSQDTTERQKRASWKIAPFFPLLDKERQDHLETHPRFEKTFKHLFACVQALIISGEVSVATAFKGHVAELSWQSRFYEVLKYMREKNAHIDTASFYENQQSLGMDSRVSDFFLVNKGIDFDFYEVVGELKNATKSNPAIFSNLLDYIQKRWNFVPDIIDPKTKVVLTRKEPIAIIMINERIVITERLQRRPAGSGKTRRYEVFCPVPYVIWNSDVNGADQDSRDMIESFNLFFDVSIPTPTRRSKSLVTSELDIRINDVITSLYGGLIKLSNETVNSTTMGNLLYQPRYFLKPFPQLRSDERNPKKVRVRSVFMDGSMEAFDGLFHSAA
jgi:hypothetical protein